MTAGMTEAWDIFSLSELGVRQRTLPVAQSTPIISVSSPAGARMATPFSTSGHWPVYHMGMSEPKSLARSRPQRSAPVVASTHITCNALCPGWVYTPLVQRQVEALAEKEAELLAAARHGAVLVSPCISPGEKRIARAALAAGRPLIVLLENGFPPFYKPPKTYFEACAAGRLLMLAPWPHHTDKRPITREQCLALNGYAKRISEGA